MFMDRFWRDADGFELQLFADDAGGADGSGGADAGGEGAAGADDAGKDAGMDGDGKGKAKYTDEDIDRILSRKFAKWQEKHQKEVDEAKKLAEMDAREKAEYERDKLQKEIDELKAARTRTEMQSTARRMLKDAGISVGDELIGMIIGKNADETKAAIEGFSKAFSAAVDKAVQERLKGRSPKGGSGGSRMTREQINAVRDIDERQRLIRENIDLFR